MADNQKVKVIFEFDRRDYENVLFLIGATNQDTPEIEKTWDAMVSEDVVLKSDSFASLGATPAEMLAMFVSFAITSVEDKVKSK
jgi:hypothetical protein